MSTPTPLSRNQYGIWALQQIAPDSAVANIALAFQVDGELRWWPLSQAVEHLFRRHRALRARFPVVGGAPTQHVTELDAADVPLTSASSDPGRLEQDLRAFARTPFDLSTDLPLRIRQFLLPGGAAVCVVLHHIVGDAASAGLLTEELMRLYDGLVDGGRVPEDLAGPFVAPAEPPRDSAAALRYWLDRLKNLSPDSMELPGSRPRVKRTSFEGGIVRKEMSAEGRRALENLTGRLRVTPNIATMAAFFVALYGAGTGPDLVLGVPVNTRDPRRHGIGLGVTTVALRVGASPDEHFDAFAGKVKDAFLNALAHSGVSIEEVLDRLGHRSGDWRAPLFRQVFNWRTFSAGGGIAGRRTEFIDVPTLESQFDLQLVVMAEAGSVELQALYSTDVHDVTQAERLLDRLENVLVTASATPSETLARLGGRPPSRAPSPSPAAAGGMSAELAAEQPDPLDPLVRWLVRQAEDLLERRIDAEIDLFDQGMTSARAAKLVAAIADECAVDIGIRPIFEDGRITALADAIRRSYPTAGRDGSPARSRTFS